MNLLFRTDASVAIGTGHVMRCLALAQAWCDTGGHATFAMAETTPAAEERLRSEGFEVVRVAFRVGSVNDAEETERLAHEYSVSWVVVDGYEFGAEYQAGLKSRGLKLLFVDDNGHAGHYSADVVLNQNAHASDALYPSRDASTRLLLGPRFAMLRREFTSWRGWNREIPAVASRVLVTMGNPHWASLREFANRSCGAVQLVENASNMPELIANADVAVAGAGTTSWEMCFLGLPALLMVLADNQESVADELGKQGIMVDLGRGSNVSHRTIAAQLRRLAGSPKVRREMSERGRALVDGRGAERVLSALNRDSLSFRLAEDGDCKLLWEWANDPVVRASSFSSGSIPWEDHVTWFRKKLKDRDCRILVALDATSAPAGQMRFDKCAANEADIDITLDGRLRGLGYASCLIDLGASWAFAEWGLTRLNAFVKPQNVASAKGFEKAGFKRMDTVTVKGQTATHYVRTAE